MSESSAPTPAWQRRVRENPFYVLGVRPTAKRADIEREGQKLLGLLEVGATAAKTYRTPFSVEPRTPELVRAAMAELRDGTKRTVAEAWARLEAQNVPAPGAESATAHAATTSRTAPWSDAMAQFGWK